MTADRSLEYLASLVNELRKQPAETEWLEFKSNNDSPEEIGEYLSALSNSAALTGKANAYIVWGIENKTHAIVGTKFSPTTTKLGGEELENWLLHLLSPKIHFQFYCFTLIEFPLVLLEIARAFRQPVQFRN
jgi:ATP-dependent DNA helicase RecG